MIELDNINFEKYFPAFEYVKNKIKTKPLISIVLGSGLGVFAESISDKIIISTQDIPGYPVSTVEGHSGKIISGFLQDIPILVFQGRIHYYEGYDLPDVIFPIVLNYLLGLKILILTNVSGGINFKPGDIVILKDHINMTFKNPLIASKFLSNNSYLNKESKKIIKTYYDPELIKIAKKVSDESNIEIKEGIYVWTLGPSYETPAEIQMFKKMGADMTGMSTIPESITANHLGLSVLGVSLISNYASGITKQKLSHQEVMDIGEKYKDKLKFFLQEIVKAIYHNREQSKSKFSSH